jgi:hypothetical protein
MASAIPWVWAWGWAAHAAADGAPPPLAAPLGSSPHRSLVLLTRAECGLCEEMEAALRTMGRRLTLPPLERIDVDSDPVLQRRYGLQIPVLLLDGSPICRTRLDEAELLRALRPR